VNEGMPQMQQPRDNSRQVFLAGVPEGHARLLRHILERRYVVRAVPGALSDLPDDLPASCVVLAGSEGLREAPRQAAMRLRWCQGPPGMPSRTGAYRPRRPGLT
jgi:hypothetical protein